MAAPAPAERAGEILTVFLAPDSGAADVLAVLADLSGAGLVDRFLWVEARSVSDRTAEGIAVVGGRRTPTSVQDALVDVRYRRVRLCVVVPLVAVGDPVPSPAEQDLAGQLAVSAGGAPLTRIRCLLSRGGTTVPEAGDVAREGWHNVLVAPERSTGPGMGRAVLPESTTPAETARQLAPVIAGLTGLWSGLRDCPLDREPMPVGAMVRVARAFYRRVQAGRVERALRERVLAEDAQLPLPRRRHGGRTVHVDDAGAACATMADRFWRRGVPGLVINGVRRPDPRNAPSKPLDFRSAWRWFFGFVWAALKGASETWYAGIVNWVRAGTARAVHAVVFGKGDTVYRVVADGIDRNGRPLSWEEIGWEVDALDASLPPPGEQLEIEGRADLTSMWVDYAGGALTLVDAGDRGGQDMPPIAVGPDRGVVRRVEDAVPGPDGVFTVQQNVAPLVEVATVPVGDVLGADLLRRRLGAEMSGQHGGAAADLARVAESLDEWERRVHPTFPGYVGRRLGNRLTEVRIEIGLRLAELRAAVDVQAIDEVQHRRQRSLARTVWVLTGVALVVISVITVLLVIGILSTTTGLPIIAGAVVVWLGGSVLTFALGQRALFQELNRRQALLDRVEAQQTNLRLAIRDYRRLRDAYGEFLHWSTAVSAVLAEPFGRRCEDPDAVESLVHGLPPSVRIGRAEVDEGAMPSAVSALRDEVFVTGWLDGPWWTNLHDAVRRWVHAPLPDRPEPPLLMYLLGAGSVGRPDAPLAGWIDALRQDGPSPGFGNAAWDDVMRELTGSLSRIGESLLSSIDTGSAGGRPGLTDFLAGIDLADGGADDRSDRRWLDANHFSAAAQADEQARVTVGAPETVRDGLSRTVVLVQMTDAFDAYGLDFHGDEVLDADNDTPDDLSF